MNKKIIKKIIIWAIFIALVATAVILLVKVVNKKETTPIFQRDGTTLLKYNGKDEEVVISKDIEIIGKSAFLNNDRVKKISFEKGSKVKTISRRAFEECTKLESIELPNTVTYIGDEAFKSCTSLTSITMPNSLTTIEYNAFGNCIKLQTITLNEGLEKIGLNAFSGCEVLTEVELPSTLVSLGKDAFYDCIALDLKVASGNTNFVITNNILYHNIDNGKKELVLSLDKNITEITSVDSSVTKICANAYANATNVKTINIPNTVKEIEENAFSGCTSVVSVTLPFIGTSLDGPYTFKAVFGKATTSIKSIKINQGARVVEKAFKGLSDVKRIELPNTITTLGSEAFMGCSSLTDIIGLPTNLKKINASTFENCTVLKEDIIKSLINDDLRVIEKKAFAGCEKLTEIVLSDKIINIGAGAFEDCKGLTKATLPFIGSGYKYDNETYEIKEFDNNCLFGYIFNSNGAGDSSNSKTLANLKEVTIIGENNVPEKAFVNCRNLTIINLSDNITSIGNYAFMECTSLTTMTLPANLNNLGIGAFQNCTKLVSVKLPETLTIIKDYTFKNCTSLASIDLSAVTSLGSNVLSGCKAEIKIDSINQKYQVINGSLYTIDDENGMRELIYYVPASKDETTLVIDSQVSIIRSGAISSSSLKKIVIPTTVKEIQKGALVNCSSLTELQIPFIGTKGENEDGRDEIFESIFAGDKPNSLEVVVEESTEIPALAFANCKIITKVIFKDTNLKVINGYAFAQCENLQEIVLGDGITTIDEYAFSGCTGLTALNVPNTVTTLGDYAFADCENIEKINIPDSLELLGVGVFRNWAKLKEFTISHDHPKYSIIEETTADGKTCQVLCSKNKDTLILYMPSNNVTSYTVPSSIRTIDSYAFSGAKLRTIVIGETVTELGDGLFYNCKQLTSVTLPKNTTEIKYSMFENCTRLKEIINTENIEKISGRAFLQCAVLPEVPLSEKVFEIGESAFEGCAAITSITIPSVITTIPKAVFKDCSKLETVVFPSSLTEIGESAFEGCAKLYFINLSEGLIRIDAKAFYQCGRGWIYERDEDGNEIKDENGNRIRKEVIIKIPTTVDYIGDQAFSGCTGATRIYLPVEVDKDGNVIRAASYVGDQAFGNMPSTKLYTEGRVYVLDEDGNKTQDKIYPTGWVKSLDQQVGEVIGRGEFKLDENGIPVANNSSSDDNNNNNNDIPKRDTKPGQCDYKENLGYYFMITSVLVSAVALLRKKQSN